LLAINRRVLYCRLTILNSSMDNTANTEPDEKALKCKPVSKTTTITYLGLGNRVTVTVSIRVKFRFRVSIRLIR